MKALTTDHVLDALTEVAKTLDSRPAPTSSATRARPTAPDVDERDETELLVCALVESIDSIVSDPDLPPGPLDPPSAPQGAELDAEQVPATRS